jgi:hypothetical protein
LGLQRYAQFLQLQTFLSFFEKKVNFCLNQTKNQA